jgi:hypothetical protein
MGLLQLKQLVCFSAAGASGAAVFVCSAISILTLPFCQALFNCMLM